MGPLADQLMDGSLIAIITAGATWVGMAKHMEKKYQTLLDARVTEATQKMVNEVLEEKLDRLKRKAMFNNLVCLRLMKEHPNIAMEEIEALRRSCEINSTSG